MTTKPKGVMIGGIEMPGNCAECPCSNPITGFSEEGSLEVVSLDCVVKNRKAQENKRPSWCPLQEVK